MSEERLIRQCAPTLAGIKTGSLFPCPYETKQGLMADVRAFNRRFAARGLCLLPLRYQDGRALLYLYRPAELRRDLQDGSALEILTAAGYSCRSCERCVTDLIQRLRTCADFPHEIGLFLSYPPEDVRGFIETGRGILNARASGRSTVMRKKRKNCSKNTKNAPESIKSSGAPGRKWTSLPSWSEGARRELRTGNYAMQAF